MATDQSTQALLTNLLFTNVNRNIGTLFLAIN